MMDRFRPRMLRREGRSPQVGSAEKIRLLRETEIFRDLTPDDMDDVNRMTTMTTCRRGRVFYSPGETGEVLFVLKKGRVQLYRLTEDGKRLVTGVVGAGSVFGEMPLLSQRMHDSVAEALEDCLLCVMTRADVEHLLAMKPRFALNVIHLLADRTAELEQRLEIQAYQSVPERLAAVLLHLADSTGKIEASHQQLAETIGASRETVTRALGELRNDGLIEMGRSYVQILDRARLATLAHLEE